MSFDSLGGNPVASLTWNRYSYVLGNPVKYVDPAGLEPIDSCVLEEEKTSCSGSITVTPESSTTSRRAGSSFSAQWASFKADFEAYRNRPSFRSQVAAAVERNGGPQPCTSWNCRVIAEVGRNAPFARAMEAAARFFTTTWILSPAGGLAIFETGIAPATYLGLEGGVSKEILYRGSLGADGAASRHIIERLGEDAISRTHQVWRRGQLIHQHQVYLGRYGGQRAFAQAWTEYPAINIP